MPKDAQDGVTILVLVETPLQFEIENKNGLSKNVTILVLVETPLQYYLSSKERLLPNVTILVLVETPLQYLRNEPIRALRSSHNPCFSGNSFAIQL